MKALKIPVINQEGEVKAEKAVLGQIFAVEASPALISQAVRRFLANQRKSRAKTKTRSEVVGSGAKIWAQKHTGRARHGDRQAPIFVGGGVAHGPTGKQNYQQRLNQKMVQKAIFSILTDKLGEKKVFLLEEIVLKKTKEAFTFLRKVQKKFNVKGKVAFIFAKNEGLKRYLNNLQDIFILGAESLDPYVLLKTDFIFLTQEALKKLEERVTVKKEKDVSRD